MKYKLTDKDGKTQVGTENETQWGENVSHTAKGKKNLLCSSGVIHCYADPYLAILINPVQGNYTEATMLLWEGEGDEIANDETKCGCKIFTTYRQIPKPILNLETRIKITIHVALQVYRDVDFKKWAEEWLGNINRSGAAAETAAEAAGAAAETAAETAAWAAAEAAAWAAWAGVNIVTIIYSVLEKERKNEET